jgi:hypothetical protein
MAHRWGTCSVQCVLFHGFSAVAWYGCISLAFEPTYQDSTAAFSSRSSDFCVLMDAKTSAPMSIPAAAFDHALQLAVRATRSCFSLLIRLSSHAMLSSRFENRRGSARLAKITQSPQRGRAVPFLKVNARHHPHNRQTTGATLWFGQERTTEMAALNAEPRRNDSIRS